MSRLAQNDPEVARLIQGEENDSRNAAFDSIRERCSAGVMEATGSVFTNKYSEGYAGNATTRDRSMWTRSSNWQSLA